MILGGRSRPALAYRAKPLPQSGRDQFVDLIERSDHFTTGHKLFEVVAAGELIIFQKNFPKV
jgi:hypothetical protein